MKLLYLVLLSVLFGGCSRYYHSFYQPTLTFTNYHMEIEKISDKEISGEASSGYLFCLLQVNGPSEFADGITYGSMTNADYLDLKSAAAYNAIKNAGCDILIAPRYIVEVSNELIYLYINVKVYGYPGRYSTIKKSEEASSN